MTDRIPTVVKLRRGNPGRRPLAPPVEPRPSWEPPSCPSWLPAAAKAEWRRILPELEATGLVTKLDRALLAAYCAAWARWVAAERIVSAEGVLVAGYRGFLVKNPACQIARDAMTQMLTAGERLGLSPRARESITMRPLDDDEDDDLFDDGPSAGRGR